MNNISMKIKILKQKNTYNEFLQSEVVVEDLAN